MKYFNKYTNKVLRNDSLDIFKNLCEDLLNNIKTPGYFKSTIPYGNQPQPEIYTSNYTVSITFFVFLSFVVEYFLFIIVYQNESLDQSYKIDFNYNTLDNKRNNYKNIWTWNKKEIENNQELKYKIYRKNIEDFSIGELLSEFCLELDRLYYRFITSIIFNLEILTKIKIKDLKKHIFPPIDLLRKIETTENKYEHIYPDWKDRIKERTRINDSQLDNIIKKSLVSVTDHSSKIDNEYTPDATGFFSWMYLIPARFRKQRNDKNMSLKFGSCITNTYLENYLLIRINENPEEVAVGLESEGNRLHDVWDVTQGRLKEGGKNSYISHWFTIWKNGKTFREAPGFVIHHLSKDNYNNIKPILNIKDNPKKMIIALICPIFDSYYKYCAENQRNYPEMKAKKELIKKYVDSFLVELNYVFR